MAVAISYSNQVIRPEFIISYSANVGNNSHERDPAIVALADGGFALAYEWQSIGAPANQSVFLERYDINGNFRASLNTAGVTFVDVFESAIPNADAAITQLTNGNILATWTQATGTGAGIRHAIVNPATGAITTADTLLPLTDGADFLSDVAALSGGRFAIVKQDSLGATDQDADLIIYNANGTFATIVDLGNNSSLDEQDPALAVLNNGNIVVAYEKETTNDTDTFSMAIEIYTNTGTVVLDQTIFDATGSQNRAPDVVALQDGGFAVAYQDNGWTEPGLSVAFFTAGGTLRGIRRADIDLVSDLDPSLSVLANGDVVVTFTDGTEDIVYSVFDPLTMTRILTFSVIETQAGTQNQSSVAALANGTFVTAWSDANTTIADGNTDPNGMHVSLQINAMVRTIVSDGAGDTVIGDQLREIFTGNGGDDRFVYAPGGHVDIWTDFTAGAGTPDWIDLSAFGLTLTQVLSLATQVGAHTVFDFGNGDTLTLQNVLKSNLSGDDFVGVKPTVHDFNTDSRGDLLFQHDNGAIGIWLMDGVDVATFSGAIPHPGDGWHAKDAADFNADGRADIVWQHDNGTPAVWLFDGLDPTAFGPALSNPGPAWHIIASADFNGNSKSDILFQHDNGAIGIWLMDGVNVGQFSGAIPHPGDGWHAKDAADFDGDGEADILWQHDNGTPAVWRFDGQDPTEFGPGLSNPGPAWHIIAAADFNGDRKSDILFQHDNGAIGIWLMDGVNVGQFSGAIPHPGAGWHAEDAVDTNGDGKADIIWQHDNGTPAVWLFDGLNPVSFGPALSNPGTAWHII